MVTGAGLTATTFTAATLRSAPRLTVTAPDRTGKSHQYEGVPLHYLLTTAGFSLDRHGPALSHVVSVAAADGYRAVLAVGEIIPDLAAQVVLVADRCDGAPLAAGAGPWQLILPADRKPTRWVRQMQRITVTLVPGGAALNAGRSGAAAGARFVARVRACSLPRFRCPSCLLRSAGSGL